VLSEIETGTMLPAHFLGEANVADIHVTPDGRFLYASERQTSTLIGFRIDAVNGFLAPIGRWNTETTPRGFAVEQLQLLPPTRSSDITKICGIADSRTLANSVDGKAQKCPPIRCSSVAS
jgi:hypothetical protein